MDITKGLLGVHFGDLTTTMHVKKNFRTRKVSRATPTCRADTIV